MVLTVYVGAVAIAGLLGALLGAVGPADLEPRLFGLLALPPTPLGTATYGAVTVLVVMGALLLAVAYVSRRLEVAPPEG